MSNLTSEQISFCQRMNTRQWNVLYQLTEAPWHMSASERSDPETYDLVRHKLARCYSGVPEGSGLWMWGATDAGKAAILRHNDGRL